MISTMDSHSCIPWKPDGPKWKNNAIPEIREIRKNPVTNGVEYL